MKGINFQDSTQSIINETDTKASNRIFFLRNSGGISGGAIAAIVICLLAALIAIGIIFLLKRKSIFGEKKSAEEFETSISNLKIDK